MAYSKQTWDTTSYVNPTRMNHIEDGIDSVSDTLENLIAYRYTDNAGPVKFNADNTKITVDDNRFLCYGHIGFINLIITLINPTTNEIIIGSVTGNNNIGHTSGSLISYSNTTEMGGFVLVTNGSLYIKPSTTSYTKICLTIPVIF